MERNHGQRPDGKRDPSEEILGRYALLMEIAAGELTTTHLARQHGSSGFQRLVALKRLKPLFARHAECVQLLLDEARLTSGLHHANVIGCLDMGTEGGGYLVQNYVEGDSLHDLLHAAGAERHARYIVPLVVDILNGLHAVHTALDDDGMPLSLVHQAVRGRHVLVGIDGTARLADFTQAKARGIAASRPRSDRLKVAYMAPEQALNPERVDHRADLFSVGVMLWEALTGQRLFAAASDEQAFQHLLHRRILRPSEVGLRPPRCFDAIVLRALEREPDKRYRSSLDMARELRDTALNHALYATTGEIGQWVKGLAGSKLLQRRKHTGADAVAGAGSNELPLTPSSGSSGFFESTKVQTNPYGSGMIFGGSFSRLEPKAPLDPDKTPAVGTRASMPARRARDDEPTAPQSKLRQREAVQPYGPTLKVPVPDGLAAPSSAAAPVASPLRSVQSADPEDEPTRPSAPMPARLAGLRQSGAESPGAYSQVAADRKGRVSPPRAEARATEPGSPTAESAGAAAPRLPYGPSAGRPAMSRVKPRPKAAVDSPSHADQRRDSTPSRLSVPSTPVGSPYRDASPSQAPAAYELPSMPRALQGLSGNVRPADVLHMNVDSLSPPSRAARTLPPARPVEAVPRSSRAMWVVTGVLAAIILLAVGVSMRQMRVGPAAPRVTAHQPEANAVTPPPAPSRAVPSVAPTEPSDHAAQGEAVTPLPQADLPSPSLEPMAAPVAPVAVERASKRRRGRGAVAGQAQSPLLPAQLAEPVAAPAPKPRVRGQQPIPDNPY